MDKKYKLTGVGCMKCVAKIEKNISELKGTENVKVDVNTKIMDISFDEEKISFDEIKNKLEELGYGVEREVSASEEISCETNVEENKCSVKEEQNFVVFVDYTIGNPQFKDVKPQKIKGGLTVTEKQVDGQWKVTDFSYFTR